MEKMVLTDDYVRDNFFGLSFSRQLKLLEICSNDLKDTDYYDYFNGVFNKYSSVILKLEDFKENFCKFDDSGRANLREIIINCRERVNSSNRFNMNRNKFFLECSSDLYDSLYYASKIDDFALDKYIYDSFSYDKERRVQLAFNLAYNYSCIRDMNFKQLLNLCGSNSGFFNGEVKSLSKDFYSLYLSLDTVQKMTYIWYMSHLNPCVNSDELEIGDYKGFSGDSEFVNPGVFNNKKHLIKNKNLYDKFSKKFKLD